MGYVPLANDWINTSLCTNVSEADFVNVWVNITDELVRWYSSSVIGHTQYYSRTVCEECVFPPGHDHREGEELCAG